MLQEILKLNQAGKIIKSKKGIHLGRGVSIEKDDFKIKEFFIPNEHRKQHFGCLGTTQTGKSKLMLYLATQDILAGNSVGIFDPKGDVEVLSGVISAAVHAGRLHQFLLISPVHPELSIKINPLAYYYIPDEIIYHVIAGVQTGEQFFFGIAREVTTAIVNYYILKALAKKERAYINFYDIAKETDFATLEEASANIRFYQNHPDERVRMLAEETINLIQRVIHSGAQYYGEVTGSLRTTLTALTTSVVGEIIGKARENELVRRIEKNEPVIFYCFTGTQITRFSAHDVAKVLLSMLHAVTGRITLSGDKLTPPLCLYLDEGDEVLYHGIESFLNKCGGAHVYIHLFTQSIAQIIKSVGEYRTQSILDNIATWVYMKISDDRSAKQIEEGSPRKLIWKVIPSAGDAKASFTVRQEEERVILAEKVKRLKPRYFYLRYLGEYYKGMVPTVPPPMIKVKLPDLKVKHQYGNQV